MSSYRLASFAAALLLSSIHACGHAQTPSGPTPAPGQLLSAPGPTFTVADKDLPATLNLIVYGDMRFTDPANTHDANPAARKALVERIAAEHPDAVQLTGDVPLSGDHVADYEIYTQETASWRAGHLRVYPALGNHEFHGHNDAVALAHWWATFPELHDRRWYSVALGKRVYLLNLDSDTGLTPGSPQRTWLEDQITHLDKSVDFVMIALHHPPVADVQTHIEVDHNPRPNEISLRDYLGDVAPKGHAQFIVTAGHIHNYERAELNGVTYLVSGGGGAKPYVVERTPEDKYQTMDFPNFHYVKFILSGRELKATMFRLADPAAAQPVWQAKDSFTVTAK